MRSNIFKYLGLLLILAISSKAIALPGDSEQPINIQADRASQKTMKNGEKTEYFGSVVITQGSLRINGEQITIHSKNRKVTSIVALGEPAHFEQQSDLTKPPIKAQANTLNYQLKTDIVILKNNASIEQNGTIVSGKKIEYNIASEQVKATGGKDDSSRVHMVLIPDNSPNNLSVDNSNADSFSANDGGSGTETGPANISLDNDNTSSNDN
jgi:lipopolysaccharide export system protein LptA